MLHLPVLSASWIATEDAFKFNQSVELASIARAKPMLKSNEWKMYWTVMLLGWQDSLVYRFNALIWVLYAILPSLTLMLVWLAAYKTGNNAEIGGFDLRGMITYYLFVTALSVVITPHPEWEMATL